MLFVKFIIQLLLFHNLTIVYCLSGQHMNNVNLNQHRVNRALRDNLMENHMNDEIHENNIKKNVIENMVGKRADNGVTTTRPSSSSTSSTDTSTETITSSSTETPDPTSVWVTGTISGKTETYQTTYSQSFYSLWTTVATPSTGTIGLGTLKGTVGTVRTYRYASG
ncbi:unnamed protein product [[Candida] boidinii]|uniref:Unnamed protein product n=1 Tax=Candida boidinii TaxID=5477 RepID=A0A9W6SXL8_CANBO|nr:unnamed protein product [[Candida] boidinii]GMF99012.1 unnamed protein product [[Candida] boidinii]